jgi:hypothetical protein
MWVFFLSCAWVHGNALICSCFYAWMLVRDKSQMAGKHNNGNAENITPVGAPQHRMAWSGTD